MNFLVKVFEGFFVTILITILVTIFVTKILLRKRAPVPTSGYLVLTFPTRPSVPSPPQVPALSPATPVTLQERGGARFSALQTWSELETGRSLRKLSCSAEEDYWILIEDINLSRYSYRSSGS